MIDIVLIYRISVATEVLGTAALNGKSSVARVVLRVRDNLSKLGHDHVDYN